MLFQRESHVLRHSILAKTPIPLPKMLDQFSRNGVLPRDASCPAAGFPANLERDMDLLLSLLGQYPAPSDLAVGPP